MKPVALLAVAVLMAACHHVPLPTPDTRPDPAAPAGGGSRVACEVVSGSNTGPGPTEGCYDGREKGPVGVPVPARVAAAPAPGAPPPASPRKTAIAPDGVRSSRSGGILGRSTTGKPIANRWTANWPPPAPPPRLPR